MENMEINAVKRIGCTHNGQNHLNYFGFSHWFYFFSLSMRSKWTGKCVQSGLHKKVIFFFVFINLTMMKQKERKKRRLSSISKSIQLELMAERRFNRWTRFSFSFLFFLMHSLVRCDCASVNNYAHLMQTTRQRQKKATDFRTKNALPHFFSFNRLFSLLFLPFWDFLFRVIFGRVKNKLLRPVETNASKVKKQSI